MTAHYQLGTADYAVLAAMFALVGLIAWRCARRTATSDAYFLADRSAPGWMVGLSFIGASISSLGFLAFPAAAYRGNWGGIIPFLMMPVVAILADRVCLPLYRRVGITSGYEYLERRFGASARLYGSAMFLLLQIGRMGLILVLLAIPLKLLTGMSPTQVIVLCGVLMTLFVFVGGLSAVIRIDMLQTFTLALGSLLCIGLICHDLPGGLGTVFAQGWREGKFALPAWHVPGASLATDFSTLTLGVLVLYGFSSQTLYYAADQNIVQRYLATSTTGQARVGLWVGSLGVVPLFCFFTFIGTCLYCYYAARPDPAVASLRPDEVFPHFILTRVPAGGKGIIIGALVAAGISSLTSSLSAIAMVFQVDIYRRLLVRDRSDRHYLRVAKLATLLGGVLVTLNALALASVPTPTLLDLVFLVYAIFAGGLAGLFLLAMLSRRANRAGAKVGIVVSLATGLYLTCSHFHWLLPAGWCWSPHPYLIATASNAALFVVGYLASLLLVRPQDAATLDALTVWSSPAAETLPSPVGSETPR
jgi:SSS family solute:Na+ symporter